jgi:hypothetical protein
MAFVERCSSNAIGGGLCSFELVVQYECGHCKFVIGLEHSAMAHVYIINQLNCDANLVSFIMISKTAWIISVQWVQLQMQLPSLKKLYSLSTLTPGLHMKGLQSLPSGTPG